MTSADCLWVEVCTSRNSTIIAVTRIEWSYRAKQWPEGETAIRTKLCRLKSQGTRDRKLLFNLIIINRPFVYGMALHKQLSARLPPGAFINVLPIITVFLCTDFSRVHMRLAHCFRAAKNASLILMRHKFPIVYF